MEFKCVKSTCMEFVVSEYSASHKKLIRDLDKHVWCPASKEPVQLVKSQ